MEREKNRFSPDKSRDNIVYELTIIELDVIDPVFADEYTRALMTVTDPSQRKKIEDAMREKVARMREDGVLRPADLLADIADSLVSFTSEAREDAYEKYKQSFTVK